MSQSAILANGVLWGVAIVAAAVAGAPQFLTLVLLPLLASSALVTMARGRCAVRAGDARR